MNTLTNRPERRNKADNLLPVSFLDLYALVTGFACMKSVRIVGVVSVGELMIAASIPIFIAKFGFPDRRNRRAWQFIIANVLLAIAITTSCLINNTPNELYLRGLMRPVFLSMIAFFFFYLIQKKPASVFYFWCGYAVACLPPAIVTLKASSSLLQLSQINSDSFIYSVANFLISGAIPLAYALWKASPLIASVPVTLAAAYAMLQGGRGVAIVFFLTSTTYVTTWLQSRRRLNMPAFSITKSALLITLTITTGLISYYAYKRAVYEGTIRKSEVDKYSQQTQTKFGETPLGLIVGARPELFVCLYGAAESPIWGLGSWPDTSDFKRRAYEFVGIPEPEKNTRLKIATNRSSGHSMILGEWMQHGIYGLAYWIYIYYLLALCLVYSTQLRGPITCLFVTPFFYASWGILFSPWGLLDRLMISLCLAGSMTLPSLCSNTTTRRPMFRPSFPGTNHNNNDLMVQRHPCS